MKHQVHVATESGIVSTEAVMQIRRLITDLARTVDVLDAAKNRPRADADDLDTRRNLMVTIASLEDRLDCIEKVRSGVGERPLWYCVRITDSNRTSRHVSTVPILLQKSVEIAREP